MFSLSGNLLAGQHDLEKERPPPSRPIPVTFPSVTPPEPSCPTPPAAWTQGPRSGIPSHFLTLKKPADVNVDTLALLNISFQPQYDFETLLSTVSNNAQSHIPPESWFDPPDQGAPPAAPPPHSAVSLLSNGRRVPDRNEFYTRAKEVMFTNKDAFLSLTRKSADPHTRLRLAHFRKFWEALDNMAYYWDNSLDEYIPPKVQATDSSGDTPPTSTNGKPREEEGETETELSSQTSPDSGPAVKEEPRKKARTEAVSDETVVRSINSLGFGGSGTGERVGPASAFPPTSIPSSQMLPARAAPPKVPWAANMTPQEKAIDPTKGSYRGYRIGNGAEMPDEYRLDCVRSFLEPITWAFGVTLVPHRRPPVLLLEHVRFPVRVNAVAWRGPQDRIKARQGWMEGPVLGVQCRPDVNFGATGNLESESALDVVRELGGLLLLAQERQREGKTEKRGGEGKWWTSKERWGGGPGGEVGEASGNTEVLADGTTTPKSDKSERLEKPEEKAPMRPRSSTKDRRRPTPAEVWKILRPGNPLWDPKVMYEAIGTDRSIEWDDVFMVSSLNHHVSVVKLRIHPYYIRYMTEGILPEDTSSAPDWCVPKLHRTRWYDLFDVEDRKEAVRGIWGVISYLMRTPEKGEKEKDGEKSDVTMGEG